MSTKTAQNKNLGFFQQVHQNRRQFLSVKVLQQFSFFVWQTDGFRILKTTHVKLQMVTTVAQEMK